MAHDSLTALTLDFEGGGRRAPQDDGLFLPTLASVDAEQNHPKRRQRRGPQTDDDDALLVSAGSGDAAERLRVLRRDYPGIAATIQTAPRNIKRDLGNFIVLGAVRLFDNNIMGDNEDWPQTYMDAFAFVARIRADVFHVFRRRLATFKEPWVQRGLFMSTAEMASTLSARFEQVRSSSMRKKLTPLERASVSVLLNLLQLSGVAA